MTFSTLGLARCQRIALGCRRSRWERMSPMMPSATSREQLSQLIQSTRKCVPVLAEKLPQGTRWRCARCGFDRHVDKHGNFPDRIHRVCDIQRAGLGDLVAMALGRIGLTKSRIRKWLTKDCGCDRRQAILNNWGFRMQTRLNALGWWLRHRMAWLRRLL
jgi:hypothetical protein